MTTGRFQPKFGGPSVTVLDDGHIEVEGLGVIKRTWSTHVDDWKDLISQAASRWGVPEAWVAGVMLQESGGQQKALSTAGCVGLMQICDPIVPISKEDLWKPENNISLGAQQLAANGKAASWNPVHVFAMYNAGAVYPFSGSAASCTHDGMWHLRENCGYCEQVIRGINTAIDHGYSGVGAGGGAGVFWKLALGFLIAVVPAVMIFGIMRMKPAAAPRLARANPRWFPGEDVYAETYNNAMSNLWYDLERAAPGDRMRWSKLPLERTKKIWRDFARTGVIRDEKGLDDIVHHMVENIALLDATTDLAGHGDVLPDHIIEGMELDPDSPEVSEAMDKLSWFILDAPQGTRAQWRISDYATPALRSLAIKALDADTPEEKIVLVDRMFNITHQRSNLANWFIEGGRDALDDLSNGEED